MSDHVESVRRDGAALVAAVERDPGAAVGCYPGWDVARLARHTGQIHRWVTGVVRTRATERPTGMPEVETDDDRLAAWLDEGVAALADALDGLADDDRLWTISRRDDTGSFWHRRMALETALHRWDAEDAQGRDATVDADLALLGVEEALRVYMEERLADVELGGTGQRIGIRPPGSTGWTVTVRPRGIEVADRSASASDDPEAPPGGDDVPDATITGSALELWLLLTCRRGLDDVTVAGDHAAAALVVGAAAKVGGPAG